MGREIRSTTGTGMSIFRRAVLSRSVLGGADVDKVGGDSEGGCVVGLPGRRTNNGGGASGSGVSTKFARPAWQTVKVTSIDRGSVTVDGRVVADVWRWRASRSIP